MWASVFSFTRLLFPKPPRHAANTTRPAPAAIPRQRSATPAQPVPSPAFVGGMAQRPRADYSSPSGLTGVPVASDGLTVVMPAAMRTVTLAAVTPATPMNDTVTLDAAANIVSADHWYPGVDTDGDCVDLPVDDAPSLLGSGERLGGIPLGYTCAIVRALTSPTAAWFRPCMDNGDRYAQSLAALLEEQRAKAAKRVDEVRAAARDANMVDLHRRYELYLNGSSRRTDVFGCDTTIFATVSAGEFTATAGSAVSR